MRSCAAHLDKALASPPGNVDDPVPVADQCEDQKALEDKNRTNADLWQNQPALNDRQGHDLARILVHDVKSKPLGDEFDVKTNQADDGEKRGELTEVRVHDGPEDTPPWNVHLCLDDF